MQILAPDTRIHYKYDPLSTKRLCGYNGDGAQTPDAADVTCDKCKSSSLFPKLAAAPAAPPLSPQMLEAVCAYGAAVVAREAADTACHVAVQALDAARDARELAQDDETAAYAKFSRLVKENTP